MVAKTPSATQLNVSATSRGASSRRWDKEAKAVFAARRQTYLDALPVAAAVVGFADGVLKRHASNPAFAAIEQRSPAPDNLVTHPEFVRHIPGASDALSRVVHFEWRESNRVDSRHFDVTFAPIGTGVSEGALMLVTLIDRTTEVRTEKSLRNEMLTDSLTGLPNRLGFIDRIEQRFAAESAKQYAIVMIDLARFARVNECIGPLGGDELIITVARRLMSTIRGYDQLGRTGANEFAMVVRVNQSDDVLHVVDRIHQALARPCRLSDFEIQVECAIGAALSKTVNEDAEQLLRFAQVAVKAAKQSGRVEFYQPATLAVARRRFSIETELRRAIDGNQLELAFQPLVSFNTGRIVGFESLARWLHPEFGLVAPSEFIAVAEESGLIVPLGQWALDRAMETLADWDKRASQCLPIYLAVNLSPLQLVRDHVPHVVESALKRHSIQGSRLAIELTESAVIADPDRALKTLEALKACDVMVAMDDFGTGFSNLASLQRLPIDTLKIDRSFVDGMCDDADKVAIIRAIQSLASALGMTTTAEGIESQDQAERLKAIGCTTGQGYLFAMPLEPDAAFEYLKSSLGLGEG
jgi:diguanylate cyclase (GGDEF)-like protein